MIIVTRVEYSVCLHAFAVVIRMKYDYYRCHQWSMIPFLYCGCHLSFPSNTGKLLLEG